MISYTVTTRLMCLIATTTRPVSDSESDNLYSPLKYGNGIDTEGYGSCDKKFENRWLRIWLYVLHPVRTLANPREM